MIGSEREREREKSGKYVLTARLDNYDDEYRYNFIMLYTIYRKMSYLFSL